MSYASITAQHTLPPDQQPKPDPSLLEGPTNDLASQHAHQTSLPDVNHKLNVVPNDWSGKTQFEEDLNRSREEKDTNNSSESSSDLGTTPTKKSINHQQNKSKRPADRLDKVTKKARREIHSPQNQFGLLSVLNVGVLAGVGWMVFMNWDRKRWDRRIVSATVIGLGALFGSQGYLGGLLYSQKKRASS
ncbi:uncharacterized protein MELLADRAFT_114031 [Melampsora larici-populina 98AG31]|uniref:Uncharacterized protein n=1 Tax=Melampsora larici-populina (strain 98AG31 / pathotype 3-4-7) TaxID=747676 RepID=F4SBX4_MELLP|nr:uncharacterized protein MELLADRAFT_114031 [Melampsora larici-populina 98AG31]EGF97855.1 hypothetical protein MELLADRAFT_114031 [Melampsora larici-populina 98AG31]